MDLQLKISPSYLTWSDLFCVAEAWCCCSWPGVSPAAPGLVSWRRRPGKRPNTWLQLSPLHFYICRRCHYIRGQARCKYAKSDGGGGWTSQSDIRLLSRVWIVAGGVMVSSGWVSSLSQNFTDKTDIWRDICVVSPVQPGLSALSVPGTDRALPSHCGQPSSYRHSDLGHLDQ